MGENEGYWSKHHTGIIQCILGFYCAGFATWEHFNPRTPPATSAASGHAAGAVMIPHYAMPFWLWAGIVALALSVAVPAIIGISRRRKPLRYQESGGHQQDELLTPLQMDSLILSRELRAFFQEINPAPELLNTGPIKEGEDIATWMNERAAETDEWHVAYGQWARKRLYGYQTRYLERVKKLANEIGAKSGMVVAPLMDYVNDVKPLMAFEALPDLLLTFLVELEKPEGARRLEAERKMQERRALIQDSKHLRKGSQ